MPRISLTAPRASGNRRGFYRVVKHVDQSKKDGFAFDGFFVGESEMDVEIGAVVVRKTPTGSVKNWGVEWAVGVVQEDGDIAWEDDTYDGFHFLSFRDRVTALVADPRRGKQVGMSIMDDPMMDEFSAVPSEGGEHHRVEDRAGRLAYTGPKGASEAIAKFLNDPATPHREGMAHYIARHQKTQAKG